MYAQNDQLKSLARSDDITFFDCRALHFAAFEKNVPVAYIRMVEKTETKFAPWVHQLAPEPLLPDFSSFPFEKYCPYKTWNLQFLQSFGSLKVGEAGKLAVHKNHRSDLFLEEFFRAFLIYCIEKNHFDSGFGVCTFALERFYKRLGFYRAKGAEPFVYEDLPEAVLVRFDTRKP